MRIRYKKAKHQRPHTFTVMTPRRYADIPRVIKLSAVGDVSDDLPDDLCYELAGKHPECLEVVSDHPEMHTKAMKAAPRNK